ncbi:MAG: lysophospholipid acyltransferase family protein [Betaproteobacteria bacterium]
MPRGEAGAARVVGVKSRPLWQRFAEWTLRRLAGLPFAWLHRLGALVGRAIFLFSPRTRARIVDNIRDAGIVGGDERPVLRLARSCAEELGKGLLEILPMWFGRSEDMLARVQLDDSWPLARSIAAAGHGAIFLTPHLGNFEIAGQFLAHNMKVTLMYRPPRIAWLDPVLRHGRTQGRASMTTADTRGVRALLKALRRGEAIGLLPDQVPARGHGIAADFFGRPAYTSTLIGKLQQASGSPVIFICVTRLRAAKGFAITFQPLPQPLPHDDAASARALNAIQEELIRRNPEQYLWSYNRHKNPIALAGPPKPGD